jgi:hypothetical protein
MKILINLLLFQAAWFACVLGGAKGLPWAGPVVVAAVVLYHLRHAQDRHSELLLIAVAATVGALFDSLLVATGALSYPSGQWHPLLAPYWIVALWAAFATTLNVSMRWLEGRRLLGFLFGAVGGPLAYLSGSQLGGVTLEEPVLALAALSLGWGLLTPLLVGIAASLEDRRGPALQRALATAEE